MDEPHNTDELPLEPEFSPQRNSPPFLTAFIALVIGALLGAGLTTILQGSPGETTVDLTDEELMAMYPFVESVTKDLEESKLKVGTLETRVSEKELEVTELKTEMKRRGKRGLALLQKLEQAQKELDSLQMELVQVRIERDDLQADLEETQGKLEVSEAELDQSREETKVAKEDSLINQWASFIGGSQLAVCEKGNRKKLGKCRGTVRNILGPAIREKFRHCVRSGQEAPALKQLTKDQKVPEYGMLLGNSTKALRYWYIQFCDPTLPEKEDNNFLDFLDDDVPEANDDDEEFNFDDLDILDD